MESLPRCILGPRFWMRKRPREITRTKECRDKLSDTSLGRPGGILIESQCALWDDLSVSRDAGKQSVELIERIFPDDAKELVEPRNKVVEASKVAYFQALQDRKPWTVIKDGKLPRATMLEFFDAIQIMFETLGWEPKHGREQMLAVGQHLRANQGLLQHFNRWRAQKDGADLSGYLWTEQGASNFSKYGLGEAPAAGDKVAKTTIEAHNEKVMGKAGDMQARCDLQTRVKPLEMRVREELDALAPE